MREASSLVKPRRREGMSVAAAIDARRSVRAYTDEQLTPEEISQLCWAAQGVTEQGEGLRAAPSAGALYPLTILVIEAEGVREYVPHSHSLRRVLEEDVRPALMAAALDQSSVGEAPLCLAVVMEVRTMARKYGEHAERYCLIEAGHVAQNVMLQATAMDLGSVPIGAFEDDEVADILRVPAGRQVVYLLPIGWPETVAAR